MLRAVRRLRDVACVPDHLWVEIGQATISDSASAHPSVLLQCCSMVDLVPQKSLTLRAAAFDTPLEFVRTLRPYIVCPLLRLVGCWLSRIDHFVTDSAAWDNEPPLEMQTLELHYCDLALGVSDIKKMISRIERLHCVILGVDGAAFPFKFLTATIGDNICHISALHVDARRRVGSCGNFQGTSSPDTLYVA
jgi:hypothetical protein